MTIIEMFGQSAILSLLGMGIVFSFLIILIISVTLVAKLVKAMKWDDDVTAPKAAYVSGAPTANASASGAAAVTAAITAAVSEHRKNNA
ncbi:MAG: sodium pump decarboxylase subunit gamma [Treponema sp. GWB1_62_6]|nr:MAG: sodium pump decarboxylase subunit gamma [Treponema sp. GWB1_62_6]OHE62324.1 MAG: sodium pump decarboxylase subunit gamma [Treponema sp. GWA1_62_8]OHE63328.1 MAG: sodium pump decarboxylase subunit gamma [Treponema sp. GWC1_61_84]HCM26294.1 sodium pump decarboxylase subunit gamma [Treponema sp.]